MTGPAVTYIFRKGSPANFSIEKLFDTLYVHFKQSGVALGRLELPYVSTGIASVLRNICFVASRSKAGVLHITGDVHYAALLSPFSTSIITVHDCVIMQRGTGIKRLVMWLLWFGLPLRLASSIVVISEGTKRELMKTVAVPERKITVIPNFVDPSFAFSERRFAGEMPRILHVGTAANKNLSRVIAALRGVPCVLIIVGHLPPPIADELRENGMRYENFSGVSHEAMANLYREADIVSFPSTYEGFGMPIVEGQVIGRPVLTSDMEPMRSVAGPEGAMLVDPCSIEAIRDGFLALIRDAPVRARLVAAGRENARRYTLEAAAAAYLTLYEKLGSARAREAPGVS